MYHDLPPTARLWSFLLAVDQDLAEETRKKACSCGGRLHSANYLRKPRGTPVQLPEQERLRFSFCCDRDGCRKRAHRRRCGSSGERSIWARSSFSISAMRQGPSPRRIRELSTRIGADESTITRWQTFWREHFPQTPFGRSHAPVSSPSARSSACPTRSSKPSSAVILRVRGGYISCGSSRRSRFPEACKSRSRHDRLPPAEDALRPRFLIGENGSSQSLHPIHEEA